MALPGKSPYDKHYIEECRKIRAEAFFKEKEERKKLDEEAATKKAAEQAAAAKPWTETAEEDRDVGVLFPGQGTQKVGMARALIENKSVQGLFDLASKILGYILVDLCAQGPQEKLNTTLYSQPAIFVCSLAAMEKAKADAPDMLKKVNSAQFGAIRASRSAASTPQVKAAASSAAALSRRRDVVRGRPEGGEGARRGDGRRRRTPPRAGMASVGGIADDKLQTALDKAAAIVGSGKAVHRQLHVPRGADVLGRQGGAREDVRARRRDGREERQDGQRLRRLPHAVHGGGVEASRQDARRGGDQDALHPRLLERDRQAVHVGRRDQELLKRQLLEPVKWEQGTKDLVTLGCTQYVEAGPGKQLKAMMRRIDNDAWGKCITLDQT